MDEQGVTCEAALARIAAFQGRIIVDFDETLCLRNSTEAWLGAARPGFVAACLLRCLDVLAPWRLWRGIERDALRVALVRRLFPATKLAALPMNEPLLAAARAARWLPDEGPV
jgi:hypothetical protein